MKQTDHSLEEIPEEALVNLFFSLIRLRQQMEDGYYINPTKALAGAVVEMKKLIRQVRADILDGALGIY